MEVDQEPAELGGGRGEDAPRRGAPLIGRGVEWAHPRGEGDPHGRGHRAALGLARLGQELPGGSVRAPQDELVDDGRARQLREGVVKPVPAQRTRVADVDLAVAAEDDADLLPAGGEQVEVACPEPKVHEVPGQGR